MTKIPSVKERVKEINIYHHELLKGRLSALFLDKKYAEALTADRTALLTELRDSGLLEEKVDKFNHVGSDPDKIHKTGITYGHNTLARAIKAHLDELINPPK